MNETLVMPRKSPTGEHAAFIAAWCSAHVKAGRGKYMVIGEKDGPAVKRLLTLGEPVEALVGLAVKAWQADESKAFWCDHAATIVGFAGAFNEIRNCLAERPSAKSGNDDWRKWRGWENGVFTGKGLSQERYMNYVAGYWDGKGDLW